MRSELKSKRVVVNDLMQQGYVYRLTEPLGRNFHPEFHPDLTPKQMLHLGVFGGKYMTDCAAEFPADWFAGAKLCHDRHDPQLNFFKVNASQPLAIWRQKGWLYDQTMESCAPSRSATRKELPSVRSNLPPSPTSGAASLGLRFAKDLKYCRLPACSFCWISDFSLNILQLPPAIRLDNQPLFGLR